MHDLANMLVEHGDYAEADSLVTEIVDMRTRLYGPNAALVGLTWSIRGELLLRQQRYDEAERVLTLALQILKHEQTDEHDDVRLVYSQLARLNAARGRDPEVQRLRRLARRP
jgi:ATP/maltotriose-dependent transcriptional regulator MalT